KVRSSAMAMHNSNDISSTTTIIFVELKKLGIQSIRCGIGLFSKNSPAAQVYAATTSPDGELATLRRSIQMTDHPALQQQYESWLKQENYIQELKQEELRSYYQLPFFYSSANYIPPENFEQSELGYYIPFSEGVFYAWTKKAYSDDEINILNRFKTIVDLTFRRYLDLQKAEAQAREAKIEAALERVRSRTMAMQRSGELAEVATVLFQQVKALGVPQWVCGFSIWEIGDKEFTWFPGSPDGEILAPCKIPLTEHPVFISFDESRRRGDELFVYEKEGEFQADHYRYMMSLPGMRELLQNMLDAGLSFPTFQIDHLANFSHGNLVFITYEHFPEMHDVFRRFAKVFDQTYTRFLDLQRSEAQAREAIKQASVDRVRAEIASMRTTSDLERITPLVWNELKTLGVSFIRCGVFIIDEEQQQVHTFLSTPDGKANASFTSAISTVSIIAEALPYWRRKEMYKAHWDEATFIEQTKHLVEQGAVSSTNTYLTENRPKNLYLHLLPFLQGILYVGNDSPLNDDELQLVQNLADAFAIAYARYED
ncbi:MAG TPA: hypothetical protein VFO37_14360, partial [Chitinophagaceae bacterium]|nr:hypothetical protein [Chitinophagaceae bacterium]